MRPRAVERAALLGLWLSEAEILQVESPDWEIWRELRENGTHGDWHAQRGGEEFSAATLEDLRNTLMRSRRKDD